MVQTALLRSVIAILIYSVAMSVTLAQTAADTLPPALLACADEIDVMRRLSCYDREMAALKNTALPDSNDEAQVVETAGLPSPAKATEPPATGPAAAKAAGAASTLPPVATKGAPRTVAEAPAPTARPAQEPEQPVEAQSAPEPAADPASDFGGKSDEPKEMSATVAEIRTRPYGELVILLDNGQVWEQKHVDNRFRLSVGEQVTISRGLISGYRLSGESNNSIQVSRIR